MGAKLFRGSSSDPAFFSNRAGLCRARASWEESIAGTLVELQSFVQDELGCCQGTEWCESRAVTQPFAPSAEVGLCVRVSAPWGFLLLAN